jgi:tRNA(adenine34) deaminase
MVSGLSDMDKAFMKEALREAQKAFDQGEVPVGAVLVTDRVILASAHNLTITLTDPTAHAEILVLRGAASLLGNYRLPETTLYVTIEPCVMCVGALLHARIERVVYGAADPKWGAMGSCYRLHSDPRFNHAIDVEGDVLADSCRQLMQDFFRIRRSGKD